MGIPGNQLRTTAWPSSGKYPKILASLASLSHAKQLKLLIFYLVNWSVLLSKRTQRIKQINDSNKPIKGQELSKY